MRGRRTYLLVLVLALGLAVAGGAGCRPRRAPGPEPEPVAWPLTGLEAPSADDVRARVVSVKIENSPAARPQTGLDEADVVYETLTEGGITRFNALYHSKAPDQVGPVRSARLSDVTLVPQYEALFAYSGANFVVESAIEGAGLDDMFFGRNPGPYQRSSSRKAPHNLYVDVPALREAAVEKGYDEQREVETGWFEGDLPSADATVTTVSVPFREQNRVEWEYRPESRTYTRDINGQPHVDTTSDGPYEARNIVVLHARTQETEKRDVRGSATLEIVLSGSGAATLFRDGKRFDGRWEAEDGSPPAFTATGDGRLPLAPGVTWIEVVPTDFEVTAE